jgi:hypothetical protein
MLSRHANRTVAMILSTLSALTLFLSLLLMPEPAHAHLEGSCLMRLADLSEAHRACQSVQQSGDQCSQTELQLAAGRRECQAERYMPFDIQHAESHGADRVNADPANSPWQQQQRREARARELFEPATSHLSRLFGFSLQHYSTMLDDNFDTDACPGAIEGRKGRYRWVGSYTLKKTDLSAGVVAKGPFQWQFAEAMVPGECYAPVMAGATGPWGAPALVNIPREMLNDLAARTTDGKVFVCQFIQECQRHRDLVMAVYQEYMAAVADYLRLERCDGIVQRNLLPQWVTRKADGPACPQAGVAQSAAALEARIEQLERGLFGRGALVPGHFTTR